MAKVNGLTPFVGGVLGQLGQGRSSIGLGVTVGQYLPGVITGHGGDEDEMTSHAATTLITSAEVLGIGWGNVGQADESYAGRRPGDPRRGRCHRTDGLRARLGRAW